MPSRSCGSGRASRSSAASSTSPSTPSPSGRRSGSDRSSNRTRPASRSVPPPERAAPRPPPRCRRVVGARRSALPRRFLTGDAAAPYHAESSAAALRQGGAVRFADTRLDRICAKVCARERLSRDDGLTLFETGDLLGLGWLADHVKTRLHGDRVHFARKPGRPGAFENSIEDVLGMIKDGVSEVHIVGGHHPDWPFEYYERLIEAIHAARPAVQIKAFTAAEIDYFWRRWKIEPKEALGRLKEAGLQSMPGGGAEIFSARLARLLKYTGKADPERWCEIHGIAHALGIKTNATMLYGHVETLAERVDHLLRLREQQDASGGFVTFIPLAYQTAATKLVARQTPPADSLKTIAASRLLLDNFPHVEAYWVTLGEETTSVALHFGADDVNGTLEDERIQHLSGAQTPAGVAREQLFRMIRDAGKIPVERDALYNVVRIWNETSD